MASKKAMAREERVVSARQRVVEHESGSKMSSLNIPEGANILQVKKSCTLKVDFIPYEIQKANVNPFKKAKGALHFERTYFTHRNIGPQNAIYCCLAATFRLPCPICEYRAQLSKSGDGDNEKEIRDLKPSERQLFNLIDLSDKEKGIQIFDYSNWLFGRILDAKIKRYDDGRFDLFADLKQGLTVEMSFDENKSGGFTSYPCVEIQFLPRIKGYQASILEKAFDLDEVPKLVPYAELKKIFLQTPPDEDEEETEKVETKGKKGKSVVVDKDEDEEEEEEEDETPPAKKGKKKPEPEEDEDEDEDEEVTAESKGIELGMMVEHSEHGTCEVVHVSSDGTTLRLKDEEDEVHRGCEPTDCELIEVKKKSKKEPPAKKGKKKPEPEPEEEDEDKEEDEDEEDEDEDEDEPVKKKGKTAAKVKAKPAKGKKKKEEDDEDDEDDEEWDDD